MIQLVKEPSGKVSGFMSRTLSLHFLREVLVPPQVRACWSSTGLGGGQVTCLLNTIAKLKEEGITRDHVVFSFVSRRIQHLQHQKHPAFLYEGVKDPTRFTLEAMSRAEIVKWCCKVLDQFDNSLVLPALFSVVNPPENTWVSINKHL